MKGLQDEQKFLAQLMRMLENQLGKDTEIVLHDLTHGYESTIVAIANGEISGRKIGDSGTNLGLEVLRGTVKDGDRYNYITTTKTGKTLRSSSMYIHDDEGKIIGSLCINTDITETLRMERYLHEKNSCEAPEDAPPEETKEIFANNVGEIIEYLIIEAQKAVNVPVSQMTKDDKIRFITFLDMRGAFLITKSSERIEEYLNISKYSLYKYLEAARSDTETSTKKGEGK